MSNVSTVARYFSTINEGFTTTTGGVVNPGADTVPLTNIAGLTDGSVFVGIIEPGDAKQQVFTGTVSVSGQAITSVKWTRGSNTTHAGGVTVVDLVTGTDFNMVTAGILKQHKQDGSHANITADAVATQSLTVGGVNITSLTPSGTVTMFAGTTAPTGFLVCDGANLRRSDYPNLYAAIGTTYGSADASHFNLPDLRGRAVFGFDTGQAEFASMGQTGGQKDIKAHSHGITDNGHNHGVNDPGHSHIEFNMVQVVGASTLHLPGSGFESVSYGNAATSSSGTGIWLNGSGANVSVQSAGSGSTNLNPYVAMNYIIKT